MKVNAGDLLPLHLLRSQHTSGDTPGQLDLLWVPWAGDRERNDATVVGRCTLELQGRGGKGHKVGAAMG